MSTALELTRICNLADDYYVVSFDFYKRYECVSSRADNVFSIWGPSQRQVQRYLRRMYDQIDEDELRFLVTNRQTLREADEDTGTWPVVEEARSETLRLAELSVNP